ncbi:5618_t:CDS:2, partial [Racocetra persica]
DKEWKDCLNEAQQIQSGSQMRDDILYQTRLEAESNPSYTFTESDIYNIALTRLEAILIRNGFRLTDFPNMPLPLQLFNNHIQQNYLLAKELQYDRDFLK